MKKNIFPLLLFLVLASSLFAQNFGLGASLLYNFQTESIGAGVRGSIFPNKKISILPQVSYFPAFNKVHEYLLGIGLEYKLYTFKKKYLYALFHGAYNNWLSYNRSSMEKAKPINWNAEIGLGISNNKCLRPFVECRYNVKFRETHINAGLLFIFGCTESAQNREGLCPAYN